MSNRRQAFNTPSSNPAKKFLEWKSENKSFQYYDKEQKDNDNKGQIEVGLPFKFLVLDEMHGIAGWNDATKSGVYANEVKFISKETMTVKPFKGNEIAKGLYKDIKEKVKSAGGYYVKSIYIMMEDGLLCNLKLKGSAVKAWGEFTAKGKTRLVDEWVSVKDFSKEKNGAVKYNVPIFTFDRSISDTESEQADECFNELEAFMKTYLAKAEPEEVLQETQLEGDELDF